MRTEPRRGALQHFYRATARPSLDEDQWRNLPAGLRRSSRGEMIQEVIDDLGDGRPTRGCFAGRGHPDRAHAARARRPPVLKKLNKFWPRRSEQVLAIAAG